MADKRATPEAPQQPAQETSPDAQGEPPRNKRVAPTIDLTATEVPDAAAAGEAADAPAAAPSKSSSGFSMGRIWALPPAPARCSSCWPCSGSGAAAFFRSPPIRLRSYAKMAALEKQVSELQSRPAANADAALAERVDKIEATLAKLSPADPATADKLAAADKAMKSLGLALTALSHRTDDAVRQRRRRAQGRRRRGQGRGRSADIDRNHRGRQRHRRAAAPTSRRCRSASPRWRRRPRARARPSSSNSGNDNAARLALSAQVLRSAVTVGAPYADELAAVKQLGGDASRACAARAICRQRHAGQEGAGARTCRR